MSGTPIKKKSPLRVIREGDFYKGRCTGSKSQVKAILKIWGKPKGSTPSFLFWVIVILLL
jgi:hypothetical protein